MKRLLALIISLAVILSGCSSGSKDKNSAKNKAVKADPAAKSDIQHPEPIEEIIESEFYKMATDSKRPIAVMIDNDNDAARPQIGLENAYLLYEIIVEGGATRIMALFKNYELDKVGPTRSSRHYFLDYALENDAIYAHAGWSPQAQRDIPNLGVNNINGIEGNDGKNFWRDNTYDNTYHNLYTSTRKLSEYAKNSKGYRMEWKQGPISFMKTDIIPEGEICNTISFAYSNMYKVSYSYNSESGLYERSINSKPHKSQTGDTLTAKNIIVYKVANSNLNDGQNKGRQNLSNIGSGEGYYISMGKAEKIIWSKSGRSSRTVYKSHDGTSLEINPGTTYIQIIPQSSSINIA